MTSRLALAFCLAGGVCVAAPVAQAAELRISINNLSPSDGVALSPFFVAAHDGTFDAFDVGSAASQGIEDVAELGDGTALTDAINSAQPTAVVGSAPANNGGFNATIFSPGSSGSIVLDVDPSIHRYLTFGSMVVPSNDAFVGNDSPTEVELFDMDGNFVAADFTLVGADVWDAGTEVNQLLGAAYVVGQSAGDGDVEGGTVQFADRDTLFAPFVGEETPTGAIFNSIPGADTPVAGVSFGLVPEPGSLGLAVLGLVPLTVRRRSR